MRLLGEAEHDAVYRTRVRPQLFELARSAESPRLVIVGGQPGAGKTAATLGASRELIAAGLGVAYINGDELRPLHPRYAELVATDKSTAADKTGGDVGLWVERGIRDAAQERYSAVIETTMRQPDVVRRTAEAFVERGFSFEMRVVLVDPELSRLGIYERFYAGLGSPGALPRFTLPSYHADALAKMPQTLAVVGGLADEVRFVDRSGTTLYSSLKHRDDPVTALATFRARALAPEESRAVAQQWLKLGTALDRDGIPQAVRDGVRAELARVARQPSGPER